MVGQYKDNAKIEVWNCIEKRLEDNKISSWYTKTEWET